MCCSLRNLSTVHYTGPYLMVVSHPAPTLPCPCHYYCAIAEGRVWADPTGFSVLCRNVGRPIGLQEHVFAVNELL